MAAVGRFSFFNIGVSSSDIVTDFLTFSYLVDDNPRWASLTLFWTIMPYLVRTVFFFHGKWTGRLKQCDTWWEVIVQYYKEAGSHLPVISTLHNIWRAKRLYDLKFGTSRFKMSDSVEVEKILAAAGRASETESNFEAGPQAVTQVRKNICLCNIIMTIMFLQLVIILSTGEVNNTQLISLVISILSLSWGASRLT